VCFFPKAKRFPLFFTEAGLLLIVGYIYSAARKKQNIYQWLLSIIYIFPFYFIRWPDINPMARWTVLVCTITSVFGFFDRIRNNQRICNIFFLSFAFFFLATIITFWNGIISIFIIAEFTFRLINYFSFYWFIASIHYKKPYMPNMFRILIFCVGIWGISFFILNWGMALAACFFRPGRYE
ncbi:MAG: hypothetical protein LBL05_06330, partial [Synergistaceae bacterium]|nr:hypothetical protein [Synergistaceae bacterium]